MKDIKRKRGRPRLTEAEKDARKKAREEMKKIRTKSITKHQKENFTKIETFLLTPSGVCPYPLSGTSEIAVKDWVAGVLSFKNKAGSKHTVQSITYWIRDFYSIFSEEYKVVSNHIINLKEELSLPDRSKRLELVRQRVFEEIKRLKETNEEI